MYECLWSHVYKRSIITGGSRSGQERGDRERSFLVFNFLAKCCKFPDSIYPIRWPRLGLLFVLIDIRETRIHHAERHPTKPQRRRSLICTRWGSRGGWGNLIKTIRALMDEGSRFYGWVFWEEKESLSAHEKVGGPLKKRFTAIVIASLIWPPDHHPVLIKTFDASR